MEEEKKVIVKLVKEPLSSEREEIREKKRRHFVLVLICLLLFICGILLGTGMSYLSGRRGYGPHSDDKFDTIKEYLNNVWLYKNDYEDLPATVEDKAYYGMTAFSEDPYTTYMSKEEIESFSSGINMDYVGIGVQYYMLNGTATVTRVFKESPAENAGIRNGDILKAADDIPLVDMDTEGIRSLVLGEKGTTVKITVERDGEDIDFMVVRGEVYSTVYATAKDDYVLLNIMSFGDQTANECIRYLDDYRDYSKLIIDLRDNSGGYQTTVQEVAGLFLGKDKVVMRQTYNNGNTDISRTISNRYYDNFKKIVILINGNTASAAEVLTICLSELHEDCTVIGETSFGKGVVQSSYRLSDGSALKITTSEWLSPSGKSINGVGIEPDIEVKLDDIFYIAGAEIPDDMAYRYDSVSANVKIAELALRYLGYDCERTDGYFDQSFEKALDIFKTDNGLQADHVLDEETFDALLSKVSYVYVTDESKDPQLSMAKEVLKNE